METLRIGVIGTGGIGKAHIYRIHETIPGAKVVVVNDINWDVATRIAKQYGARFENDPFKLINSDDVDAVIIASWDPTHEEYSIACLNANKYVLCEKPLATSVDGCKNIMDAEIAGGKRLLQVGFHRRYDDSYRQMKCAIDNGQIGAPLIVHAQHRNKYPSGAKHTTEMTVKGSMVHEFDTTRWLLGEEFISAQLVCPRSSRHADADLIDPQLVYLETKSGVRAEFEMFMNSTFAYEVQCEIVGEDGTLRLPDPATIVRSKAGVRGYEIFASWSNRFEAAYEVELREWVKTVKEDKITGPSAWDGYMSLVIADACTKSRLENTIVPIEPIECPELYHKV